jgi:hypothetical protein
MGILKKSTVLASFVLCLTACTVQLAPDYDASLVDGLNKSNANALVLFASLEKGAKTNSYAYYETRYDAVIGAFTALKTQAEARTVPPLGVSSVARAKTLIGGDQNSMLAQACATNEDCVNPTPKILESLIDTLRRLEKDHKSKGFAAASANIAGKCSTTETAQATTLGVMPYECAYLHGLEEALFVETSLKRN